MIRMLIGRYITHGQRIMGGCLYFPRRKGPGGVAIKQQGQHHSRMIGIGAAAGISPLQDRYIQLVNNFDYKTGQMIIRKPFVNRGGSR
jgi:hypothetical protein